MALVSCIDICGTSEVSILFIDFSSFSCTFELPGETVSVKKVKHLFI